MKFGEKLREKRKKIRMSQDGLAKELGVTTRTLSNYEMGASHPQDRAIYFKLADFFGVDVNYFLTEDEEFLTKAAEHYGKKGRDQAEALLDQAAALFAGGELSEEDKLAFLHEMQALFLDSKQRERERFAPKRRKG
ncbi:MAG: helix-turn-helix domain-containing protein [Defluviitaleaceae bacterium]|nr:helix-turn-helix domain-containing protein [Defluviitaleaceae bacterium]